MGIWFQWKCIEGSSEFRVSGFGFRASGFGFQVSKTEALAGGFFNALSKLKTRNCPNKEDPPRGMGGLK
jgi:hypothetical protein